MCYSGRSSEHLTRKHVLRQTQHERKYEKRQVSGEIGLVFILKLSKCLVLTMIAVMAVVNQAYGMAVAMLSVVDDNAVISIVDPSVPAAFLKTVGDGERKAISFALEDDSVEYLARVDMKAGSGAVRCFTNTGKAVDVWCEYSDTYARVTIEPVAWRAREITLRFRADRSESFFNGSDPWTGSVNQRGKKVVMSMDTSAPDRCCHVPFFMSSRGYGLYVESREQGVFTFPKEGESGVFEVSFRTVDSPRLTFYYFSGSEPKKVFMDYVKLTLMPPLPPKWNFLPWVWDEMFEDARGASYLGPYKP